MVRAVLNSAGVDVETRETVLLPRASTHDLAWRPVGAETFRAVRDPRYKYIRNYRTEQGYYLPLAYRERIPTMQELLRFRD